MTREELYNLYDKICGAIDGFKDYHYYYCCCNETYNGTSLFFEVHIDSDKEDEDDVVEDWRIDDCGRIHTEDAVYENYEEFLKEWI